MEILEDKFLKLLRDGIVFINQNEIRYGHSWLQGQPNLVVFMQALEAFKKEFNDKAEAGKKTMEVRGPRLHTNDNHEIKEVFSNEEVEAIDTLVNWCDM